MIFVGVFKSRLMNKAGSVNSLFHSVIVSKSVHGCGLICDVT